MTQWKPLANPAGGFHGITPKEDRNMECSAIFCFDEATVRVTVPRLEKRTPLCKAHADGVLEWAEPWKDVPGMVVIENIETR